MRRRLNREDRSKSEQGYETPQDLLDAIRERWRFQAFHMDLAAERKGVSKAHYFIGPEEDSLKAQWPLGPVMNWLNPPFAHVTPWAKKCAEWVDHPDRSAGSRLFFLVPASVGSVWFSSHTFPKALVLGLQPRVKFVGESHGFIKDLILAVYGETPGFGVWRWRR